MRQKYVLKCFWDDGDPVSQVPLCRHRGLPKMQTPGVLTPLILYRAGVTSFL